LLSLRGLALDVDDADDLHVLLTEGPGTRSARLVAGWKAGALR
jgi:2-phospho-L-lactate guanylyltransferase (CobY/MobA/RfbA family)